MKRCPKCGKSYPDEANFCPTDAGRLVVVATDAIPAAALADDLVAGRFQLGPTIGGSRTGEVRRATDVTGAAPGAIAIKLVAADVLAMPQVAQRIDRELKQLERVQHRGVAKVIASGKHGDQVFVATELIEGARPLADLVAASGPIDAQRASEIVLAIGDALIEAAKVGVVHRDLSPENILVTPDSIRLINFAVPTPGAATGYVAPEVADGKPVDQRSNIYSLGAIHYFLLTGAAPQPGADGSFELPSKKVAVGADVDTVVCRALDRNPAKRYLTLRQFLDEVERVAQGPEGGTGSTAPFGRAGLGKGKELSATLMGFGFGGNSAPTRQMDVQIPPEAMRDAAALDAAVKAAAPAPASGSAAPTVEIPGGIGAQESPRGAAPAPSPWAPQAQAQPQPAPAEPPPPQVAPPKIAAQPAGKKKPAPEQPAPAAQKGKFRETMWFKKGELDAAAAEAAAEDANAAGKADLLPIEERYNDDGSLERGDAEKYSLRTGATSMMPAMGGGQTGERPSVSERELVGEMKGGRNLVIIVIVVAVLVVIGIIAAFLA